MHERCRTLGSLAGYLDGWTPCQRDTHSAFQVGLRFAEQPEERIRRVDSTAPRGVTPTIELRGKLPLEPRLVARGTDADSLANAISGGLELVDEAFRRRCRIYACSRFSLEKTIVDWENALFEVVRSHENRNA